MQDLIFFSCNDDGIKKVLLHPSDHSDRSDNSLLMKPWDLDCEQKDVKKMKSNGTMSNEKHLFPKLVTVNPEVTDKRMCAVKEMPTVKESLDCRLVEKKKESKRISHIRDRKHWHQLFLTD